jgi:hypothetical protein
MTNQGVNFQLPSEGQFSVAVDTGSPASDACSCCAPQALPRRPVERKPCGRTHELVGHLTAIALRRSQSILQRESSGSPPPTADTANGSACETRISCLVGDRPGEFPLSRHGSEVRETVTTA